LNNFVRFEVKNVQLKAYFSYFWILMSTTSFMIIFVLVLRNFREHENTEQIPYILYIRKNVCQNSQNTKIRK